MKGVFISATGTDIGKTYVSALLVKCLKDAGVCCGYYKPALSGAELINGKWYAGDREYVKEIAHLKDETCVVSHVYKAALSPHLASRLEDVPFSLKRVEKDVEELSKHCEFLLAEGCGGIICPLTYEDSSIMLTDVIKALDFRVIIVVDAGLGTINATILTIEYAKAKGIHVIGIILNHYDALNRMHRDNKYMIEHMSNKPVIAMVGENDKAISKDVLAHLDIL